MRIGIVPCSWRASGGTFQYSLTMLNALRQIRTDDEFVVFHDRGTDLPLSQTNTWSFETVALELPQQGPLLPAALSRALNGLGRVAGEGPVRQAWRRVRRSLSAQAPSRRRPDGIDDIRRNGPLRRLFESHGIELVMYLSPTEWSFETGIPYLMAIHDLLHCFHPEFPEAFVSGDPDYYEYLHRNGTRYAAAILVDSDVGKEDVLRFYGGHGITADRVEVLPFLPAHYLPVKLSMEERQRVVRRYHLPERYLFYPARFWLHKNHRRLFEALRLLEITHHSQIDLVLVGFDMSERPLKGELAFHEMSSLCQALGLQGRVHFLGQVPDDDMAGLYAAATGLVMPTLCGPTNIPVLEAWQMGCPVITSDIRGIHEHAGAAAILVDPCSVEAIADGIHRFWTDARLRCDLVQRGLHRLAAYTPDDYRDRLIQVLENAKARVRSETVRT